MEKIILDVSKPILRLELAFDVKETISVMVDIEASNILEAISKLSKMKPEELSDCIKGDEYNDEVFVEDISYKLIKQSLENDGRLFRGNIIESREVPLVPEEKSFSGVYLVSMVPTFASTEVIPKEVDKIVGSVLIVPCNTPSELYNILEESSRGIQDGYIYYSMEFPKDSYKDKFLSQDDLKRILCESYKRYLIKNPEL